MLTFDEWIRRVRALLEPTAAGKGYHDGDADGKNLLYEFVADTVGGDGHALGECLYKIVRYAKTRNPEDMLKVAAWTFLILRHRKEEE